MSAKAIFSWAKLLAPLVLANIPQTRPIAAKVGELMEEAEAIPDSKGPAKLSRVIDLLRQTGETINLKRPGTVDLPALAQTVQSGIDTAFGVARLLEAAHGEPVAPETIAVPELGTAVAPQESAGAGYSPGSQVPTPQSQSQEVRMVGERMVAAGGEEMRSAASEEVHGHEEEPEKKGRSRR